MQRQRLVVNYKASDHAIKLMIIQRCKCLFRPISMSKLYFPGVKQIKPPFHVI